MAVSSRQTTKQRDRISRVQEIMSTHITVNTEASIDLLLALLCYIEWCGVLLSRTEAMSLANGSPGLISKADTL